MDYLVVLGCAAIAALIGATAGAMARRWFAPRIFVCVLAASSAACVGGDELAGPSDTAPRPRYASDYTLTVTLSSACVAPLAGRQYSWDVVVTQAPGQYEAKATLPGGDARIELDLYSSAYLDMTVQGLLSVRPPEGDADGQLNGRWSEGPGGAAEVEGSLDMTIRSSEGSCTATDHRLALMVR